MSTLPWSQLNRHRSPSPSWAKHLVALVSLSAPRLATQGEVLRRPASANDLSDQLGFQHRHRFVVEVMFLPTWLGRRPVYPQDSGACRSGRPVSCSVRRGRGSRASRSDWSTPRTPWGSRYGWEATWRWSSTPRCRRTSTRRWRRWTSILSASASRSFQWGFREVGRGRRSRCSTRAGGMLRRHRRGRSGSPSRRSFFRNRCGSKLGNRVPSPPLRRRNCRRSWCSPAWSSRSSPLGRRWLPLAASCPPCPDRWCRLSRSSDCRVRRSDDTARMVVRPVLRALFDACGFAAKFIDAPFVARVGAARGRSRA